MTRSISTRSIAIFVALGLALSAGASFVVSKTLSQAVSGDVQERVIDLIFDSVVAGPLTFARLHSSAIANEQLSRLMTTPALKERGVFGVTILGGENKQYEYAKWLVQAPSDSQCIQELNKSYDFPDSIHPFEIKLFVDTCAKLGERETILNYTALANIIAIAIAAFLLFIAIYPMVSSIQKAEQVLEANSRDKTAGISLTSIRSLVEKAMTAAELEKEAAISGIARQVAHDIRSPLSALNLVTANLPEASEDKRAIIRNATQRINDIANNLLKQGKGTPSAEKPVAHTPKSETMLAGLVDALVSEKRIQYRNQMSVQIEQNLNEGYALFANLSASEISRALSNLINNSVEALPEEGGKVSVSLRREGSFACIEITDNGKGIPSEVLHKIGQKGFSYGKENSASGSGLGVSHAKQAVSELGGRFEMESTVGIGTTIRLLIPASPVPAWFVDQLVFRESQVVVSIDDDRTIHQVWQKRFSDLLSHGKILHLAFSAPAGFNTWYENLSGEKPPLTLLVDFEFIGSDLNGLDLIEKNNLGSISTLVTSRFEEPSVRERAQKLGIKILPKGLSPFVPISLGK